MFNQLQPTLKKGVSIKPIIELNEVNILLQFIKTGRWATVLSQATVAGKDYLKAIPLDVEKSNMDAALITLKNVYKKNAWKAFTEILMTRSDEINNA